MNALVTGGTKGIGFGIAGAMAAAGGQVMITGRDAGGVERAVKALSARASGGGRVIGAVADVRDRAAIEAAVAGAVTAFGSLDTLINNAGVGRFTPVEQTSDDDWHQVIDTNLTGVFYATRAAIPVLRKIGRAHV